MRMFLLYYGKVYVDKGLVLTNGKDLGKIVKTPIWGALIDTGSKQVLIDTGINPINISDPGSDFKGTDLFGKINPILSEADLANNRVKSCGIEPDDIDFVINTHFHFDHCGGNLFFPQAEFIIQEEHFKWAIRENHCPRYNFDLNDIKWRFINGKITLLPGIDIIPTPGHVPGHQSVIIYLKRSGPIILTGDAITLEETMSENAPVTAYDVNGYHRSVKKLVTLRNKLNGQLFIAHEWKRWKEWKHSPEWYD